MLYLVGDIIDGWKLKNKLYWPQEHSDVVREILMQSMNGTKVIYLVGNHDEFLRPWIKYHHLGLGNILIKNKHIHTTATGQRLLVVHGDQFDSITRYHRWLAVFGDHMYEVALMLNVVLNRVRMIMRLPYWSLSRYLKRKVKQALEFIYEFEKALVHAAKKEQLDGVVCGHIHWPVLKEIEGITYCNTGDWVDNCSALVEHADGKLGLVYWREL